MLLRIANRVVPQEADQHENPRDRDNASDREEDEGQPLPPHAEKRKTQNHECRVSVVSPDPEADRTGEREQGKGKPEHRGEIPPRPIVHGSGMQKGSRDDEAVKMTP